MQLNKTVIVLILSVAVAVLPSTLERFHLGVPAASNLRWGLPPTSIYWGGFAIIDWMDRMMVLMTPPNLHLIRLLTGSLQTACIYTAYDTGLVSALGTESKSITELAEAMSGEICVKDVEDVGSSTTRTPDEGCEAVRSRIMRLLRALETIRVVRWDPPRAGDDDGKWSLSRIGRYLLEDDPLTIAPATWYFGGELYKELRMLPNTILKGNSAYNQFYGMEMWDHYRENPVEGEKFDAFMSSLASAGVNKAIAEDYSGFSQFETVVELGCGQGTLLDFILQVWPDIRKGVCVDLEEAIQRNQLKYEDLPTMKTGRLKLAHGSFFEAESIPVDGDAYILKQILHDWDNEHSIKILKNIRITMSKDLNAKKRLLIVDSVLLDHSSYVKSLGNAFTDIVMLSGFGTTGRYGDGARERTLTEWETLLARSGFKIETTIRTRSPYRIIVATLAD